MRAWLHRWWTGHDEYWCELCQTWSADKDGNCENVL